MKAAQLRQSILQAAVQGKLVTQNVHDEPASELLARIRKEKERLIKEGKIKKEKPLPPIEENEIPYDLPDGWGWCRLGEIVSKVGSGSTPSGGRNAYPQNGVKFLRSQNVYNHGLVLHGVAFIDDATHERMKNTKVLSRDILLNITGASIGRCCIVPDDFDTANVNQHVSIIRTVEDSIRFYIHILLISPHLQNHIMDTQVGVSREGLSCEKIKLFLVPLPPLAEQQRIVAKVDELMVLCDELEAAEKELDTLENRFTEYLPKSILQAAVQGKLVPQNAHDEPASELLVRIRQEKARLVNESKIKKEKPLPPITEDEIPYDLPDGWVWCRLREVCIVNPRNLLSDNTTVAFVPMSLISSDYSGGHAQEERLWGTVKSGFTHFAENDIAIAKITPCFQNGKSCITRNLKNGFGAGTTELHILRSVQILPEYILVYAKHPHFLIEGEHNMTGTAGQQRVPTEYIANCLFPLPPLTEQQRIVAKVDELMLLCDELKAAKEISVKSIAAQILHFQHTDEGEPEHDIGIAARGDGEDLPPEALADIAKLFGEDKNA